MNRIKTLFYSAILGSASLMAHAESTFSFVRNGEVIPDGSTVVITEHEEIMDFLFIMESNISIRNNSAETSKAVVHAIGIENYSGIELSPGGNCYSWSDNGEITSKSFNVPANAIQSLSVHVQLLAGAKSFSGSISLKVYTADDPEDCSTITVKFDSNASGTEPGNTDIYQLAKYEYWFDSNYADKVVQNFESDEITQSIDVSSLSSGLHTLNFRLFDTEGRSGSPQCFFVYLPNEAPAPQMELLQYEYWMDMDYANHVTMEISGEEAVAEFAVDVASLKPGLHLLFVRAQNSEGLWGRPEQYAFYLPDEPVETDFDVAYYEYWFDGNYADHKRVDVNAAGREELIQIDIADLEPGVHLYHLRACNTLGVRGVPVQYIVNVPAEPEPEATPLVGLRYTYNQLSFEEEMDPTDDFEMADFEFELPEILDVATFAEDRCEYTFDATTAHLERTTDVNFSISFVNEEGVWSNPATFMYQEEDALDHDYIELVQNEVLELDKTQFGDFYALKFSVTKIGNSYFAADQDCTFEVFKATTGERFRVFSSEEMREVKSIAISKGTYYVIVHSMPRDRENPSKTLRLLFSNKKEQLIYYNYDINMDGEIDQLDVDCLSEYLIGILPEQFDVEAADTNHDGIINVGDVIFLMNKLK